MSETSLKNGGLSDKDIENGLAAMRQEGVSSVPLGVLAMITDNEDRRANLLDIYKGKDGNSSQRFSGDAPSVREPLGIGSVTDALTNPTENTIAAWKKYQQIHNEFFKGPGFIELNEHGFADNNSIAQQARDEKILREMSAARDNKQILQKAGAHLGSTEQPLLHGNVSQQDLNKIYNDMIVNKEKYLRPGLVVGLLPPDMRESFLRQHNSSKSVGDAQEVNYLAGRGPDFRWDVINPSYVIKMTQDWTIAYNKAGEGTPGFKPLSTDGAATKEVLDAEDRVENFYRQELAAKDKAAADLQAKNAPPQNEQPKANGLLKFMSIILPPMGMWPVADAHQDGVHPGTSGVAPGGSDRTPH